MHFSCAGDADLLLRGPTERGPFVSEKNARNEKWKRRQFCRCQRAKRVRCRVKEKCWKMALAAEREISMNKELQ